MARAQPQPNSVDCRTGLRRHSRRRTGRTKTNRAVARAAPMRSFTMPSFGWRQSLTISASFGLLYWTCGLWLCLGRSKAWHFGLAPWLSTWRWPGGVNTRRSDRDGGQTGGPEA